MFKISTEDNNLEWYKGWARILTRQRPSFCQICLGTAAAAEDSTADTIGVKVQDVARSLEKFADGKAYLRSMVGYSPSVRLETDSLCSLHRTTVS